MRPIDEASRNSDLENWAGFASELRRRELGALRQAVMLDPTIDLEALERNIENITEKEIPPAAERFFRSAFEQAGQTLATAQLLATYVYARTLEIWELTSEWRRIENLVQAATNGAEAAAAVVEGDCPSTFDQLSLMLSLARSVAWATQVENALNCSCPVGMEEAAQQVVVIAEEVLSKLEGVAPGREPYLDLIRTRAQIDQAYFTAIIELTEAVGAYIDCAPEASSLIEKTAAALAEVENSDLLDGDVYQTEIRAHRLALEALGGAWPRIHVDSGKVIYCYGFAFRGVPPSFIVSTVTANVMSKKEIQSKDYESTWKILGTAPSWHELPLSDMWTGRAPHAERFTGIAIALPSILVRTTAHEELAPFELEIRLSNLGNHYLRVEHPLQDATIHDLNQAMRRATKQMGEEAVYFGQGTWRTMSDLVHDLIDDLSELLRPSIQQLNVNDDPVVGPSMTAEHVIVSARRMSLQWPDGERADADIDRVTTAAGASLVFQPIRQAAIALEEWVRYPIPDLAGRNLLATDGFTGDFVLRTANSTFALLAGIPDFLARDHEQAAEFVAALPALLQSWLDEIRYRSPNIKDRHDGDAEAQLNINELKLNLRSVLAGARTMLAHIHSPGLCLTVVQRELLDRFFENAGIPRMERELQDQFEVANASYGELSGHQAIIDAKKADLADQLQNKINRRLGVATALFGATSIAGVFQLLNSNLNPSVGWIVGQCLLLVFMVAALLLWFGRKSKMPGQKVLSNEPPTADLGDRHVRGGSHQTR